MSDQRHLYAYVGPKEIAERAMETRRARVESGADVVEWAKTQSAPLVATFVVDAQGQLWLADRRSEHFACARGGVVQAADELFLKCMASKWN